jgi:hypothetical protein
MLHMHAVFGRLMNCNVTFIRRFGFIPPLISNLIVTVVLCSRCRNFNLKRQLIALTLHKVSKNFVNVRYVILGAVCLVLSLNF